jgi:branched-chain amino acid transport system permease protein
VSASPLLGLYLSLVSGISYGLIISLLAGGLSLIYGVMNNVNTSHGAFYMMGGFLTFFAVSSLHLPIGVLCNRIGLSLRVDSKEDVGVERS